MKYTATALASAGMVALTNAHGFITKPAARMPGTAMQEACGMQVYYNQKGDNYGNVQGELQVAKTQDDYNEKACNIWMCKGYKYADNTANVQKWTVGQVVPITVDIRAPHTGTANVSIVETATDTMVGSMLKHWDVYASVSTTIPEGQKQFDITIPELNGKCTQAGACVLQWWWDAHSIDQTYESCVDFTVSGGSGSKAVVSSANSQVAQITAAPVASSTTAQAVASTCACSPSKRDALPQQAYGSDSTCSASTSTQTIIKTATAKVTETITLQPSLSSVSAAGAVASGVSASIVNQTITITETAKVTETITLQSSSTAAAASTSLLSSVSSAGAAASGVSTSASKETVTVTQNATVTLTATATKTETITLSTSGSSAVSISSLSSVASVGAVASGVSASTSSCTTSITLTRSASSGASSVADAVTGAPFPYPSGAAGNATVGPTASAPSVSLAPVYSSALANITSTVADAALTSVVPSASVNPVISSLLANITSILPTGALPIGTAAPTALPSGYITVTSSPQASGAPPPSYGGSDAAPAEGMTLKQIFEWIAYLMKQVFQDGEKKGEAEGAAPPAPAASFSSAAASSSRGAAAAQTAPAAYSRRNRRRAL